MRRLNLGASHLTALAYGAFAGLLGIEHGRFEIVQGNTRPGGLLIQAMGAPCQAATSLVGCEPALPVIPSFLITGLLAIMVSLGLLAWASVLVPRRHSGLVLLGLSFVLLLVGDGFTPLPFGIFAGLAAANGNRAPGSCLPAGLRRTLAMLWPWAWLTSVSWYLGIDYLKAYLHLSTTVLGLLGLGLCLLTILTGAVRGRRVQLSSPSGTLLGS